MKLVRYCVMNFRSVKNSGWIDCDDVTTLVGVNESGNILNNTFKEIEDITDVHQMTNQQLKRLIQKIEVDKEGNVDIYLRLLGDLGLDESVLIEENETVLNCDDQT